VGGAFTCAVLHDGTVHCWGFNNRGQLGDGSLSTRLAPVAVAGLEDVVGLATGAIHTCALLGNGQVSCWGGNAVGQLGDGTTTDRLVPTPVVGLPSAVAVAAGLGHTCALLADGTARCWGKNDQGQLGTGITGNMTVPVTPLDLTGTALIATGGDHTCSSLVSGEVRCWGDNGVNQASHLSGDQLSPVTVVLSSLVPLRSVIAIATGNSHSCALQSSGAVYCWGANQSGQLGDGSTTSRQFPTEVPSFRFNIAESAKLDGRGRVARVTALMNCPEGAQVEVAITVTQDGVSGAGNGIGKCTGALEEYPVAVPALGRHGFEPGTAVATADAVVRHRGQTVETQEWTRDVALVVEP
jgi:alpha-tubulin suppressor-like RCC1 family protein